MPTVWASVPVQAPTTTSLRPSPDRIRRLTSAAASSGNSRRATFTADRSTRWLTGPYTMKNVNDGPMALACTTIAGSRPIFLASCSAAPSASARSSSLPDGTGSVNETCTRPSPVVSPYGRTTVSVTALRLQELTRRVPVAVRAADHAVQPAAAVGGAAGDAECALADRGQQALAADLLQQF